MGEHPAGHMYDTPLPLTRETAPLPLHPSGVGAFGNFELLAVPVAAGPWSFGIDSFRFSHIPLI